MNWRHHDNQDAFIFVCGYMAVVTGIFLWLGIGPALVALGLPWLILIPMAK